MKSHYSVPRSHKDKYVPSMGYKTSGHRTEWVIRTFCLVFVFLICRDGPERGGSDIKSTVYLSRGPELPAPSSGGSEMPLQLKLERIWCLLVTSTGLALMCKLTPAHTIKTKSLWRRLSVEGRNNKGDKKDFNVVENGLECFRKPWIFDVM